ncbi:hypothetical protein PQJ75_21925 [Rhodoplanes sp. TEM]|uniref:MAPEG family protein n=1 Tax=Rhodoplanes tepidamans TaxID=200616 RepID=A0ABT5JJ20_RHOTP|nr:MULTISPECIES: hypothetical protein [Rhodoplanes]MDC7789005.1 hypothetical protein [Rhodoplanes tepidamans]MDC7986397.1 hypothetical protein [Rhodoplanes sp. TEM]MDQ0355718.1 hypothetical protein [Rhodoplanes tepidamans]
MSLPLVLGPTIILVALTFLLMLCAGGRVATGRSLTGRGGAVSSSGCAAALDAQYRLPVLLYVLTVLSMATRHADLIFVLLAWVFAVLRVLQALALATGRAGTGPGMLDAAGALVLAVAWGVFAVRILLGF